MEFYVIISMIYGLFRRFKQIGTKRLNKPLDINPGLKLLELGLIDEDITYGNIEEMEELE